MEVLAEKIESLRKCLVRVEEKTRQSFEEFKLDLDAQDVTVLNLERAVQLCVDMAMKVLAKESVGAPESMADSFEKLLEAGILSAKVAERMRKAVGFRNLAVHEYDELDLAIVYKIATQHTMDFKDFVQELLRCTFPAKA